MVIFNHGKERGDPHLQARSRPLAFAREFVRRGYVVVAPNRRGFAQSGGTYSDDGCDVAENGVVQASDIAATVAYMQHQPYVDASRIVVAGVSHGGLASLAYADEAAPGVRAVLNFAGGLRQDNCADWQGNLVHAFGLYGEKARVPSLWFYGDNDSLWPPALASALFTAYTHAGGNARLVDFGDYKDDAHRLVGDRDAVPIWWPHVASFLAKAGLPTAIRYSIPATDLPPPTDYAPLDAIDAVPFVGETGRQAYRTFLAQYPTRAFAVSDTGAWASAEGGDNPLSVALDDCQRHSRDPCKLYAVDNSVVWTDR
jgi:dienelactone hydrolase